MEDDVHLALRLERLGRNQEWFPTNEGLCFLFPRGDGARFISGVVSGCIDHGDVLVMNGTRCKLWAPNDTDLVFWWFSLGCEHLFPLFNSNEIYLVHSVMEEFKRAKVFHANEPAAALSHRLLAKIHPHVNLEHRSELLRVAAAVLANEFEETRGHRVGFIRAEEHVVQVLEKLPMSDILSLPVRELAHRFGFSRRHLNRLFHRYYGVSVGTMKTEVRLSKAVALLRDPDAKIIRIAEEVGFNHLSSFNICFKRHFGVSPSEWRKSATPECVHTASLGGSAPNCPISSYGLCPWYDRKNNGHPPAALQVHATATATQLEASHAVRKMPPRVIHCHSL